MDLNKQTLMDILNTAKNIFQLNEKWNPQAIFKNKTFLINGKDISVENNNYKDSRYYFEHPEIDGIIVKNENNIDYCIKAAVQYINNQGKERWFAKIRIDNYYGDFHIHGRRTGSSEMSDCEDEDFIENPDDELPLILEAMKKNLGNIYSELYKNIEYSIKYEPSWVKKIKKYNN